MKLAFRRTEVWGLALWDEGVKCPTQHPSLGWEGRCSSLPPRGDFVICQ